jgi:3-oxoacyl-[acyl-carrier protein] reductase
MNPASGAFANQAREYIALQRYAHAAEIADFVAYLANPGASLITGASLWPSTAATLLSTCLR